jgi:hypothetical protein
VHQRASLHCTKEPGEGTGTNWETDKDPNSNNRPTFRRQKGRLITSQRPPSNPIWDKIRSLKFREQGKIPPGIREIEHLLGFLTSKIDQDGEQHK